MLVDKAFDTDWLIRYLDARCSKAVIPPKANRSRQRDYDQSIYQWRHLIENFFCRLKEFKKIAMSVGKTDQSFTANIYFAAAVLKLSSMNVNSPKYNPIGIKNQPNLKNWADFIIGAGTKSRTRDLLITSQLLYQLSYTG